MESRLAIELVSLVVGGSVAVFVLRNPKTQQAGIGPNTRQALALSLLAPIVLILGIEKTLSNEAIAAIIGGLVGFGLPKGKEP